MCFGCSLHLRTRLVHAAKLLWNPWANGMRSHLRLSSEFAAHILYHCKDKAIPCSYLLRYHLPPTSLLMVAVNDPSLKCVPCLAWCAHPNFSLILVFGQGAPVSGMRVPRAMDYPAISDGSHDSRAGANCNAVITPRTAGRTAFGRPPPSQATPGVCLAQ